MVSLILGIVTGTLQWLVLRKQVHKSILWILISSFGWVLSIISGSFVGLSLYYLLQGYANRFSTHVDINPTALIIWPVILAGVATGIAAGAITGTALVRLLQPSTLVDVSEPGDRIITF
jgi:hypothetical protein